MSSGLLMQAQTLIDNEQYDSAYDMLQKSYDKYKEDAEYLEKIALLAKMLEKKDDEMKYWEELVVVNPNSVVAYSELLDFYNYKDKYKYYLTRAKYKVLNNQVNQSIDDYKKALSATAEEQDIINARFLLAKAYEHVGKTQNAIDEYYRIIEQKDDMAIYYKLADMYVSIDDRFSAINVLEKGVKAFPEVVELKEFLSQLLMKEGQYDNALTYAQNDFSKIKIYLMKGENEEAFKLLEKVNPNDNPNYWALMAEYYFNTKDYEKCKENITKFRELAPNNPLAYQMLALVHDANDDTFGYHFYMGRCYSYKQDYELALVEYLNAHRVDPNRAEAIKEIIKINESTGDKTSLMEFYEKLLRQEPENTIALKGLGDVYSDMYEFRSALEYYKKFIKIDTNNYEVYNKMGFCYEKIKDMVSAKECYEKYIEKAPLSPDTEKLKEKISKITTSSSYKEADSDDAGFIGKIMKIFGK